MSGLTIHVLGVVIFLNNKIVVLGFILEYKFSTVRGIWECFFISTFWKRMEKYAIWKSYLKQSWYAGNETEQVGFPPIGTYPVHPQCPLGGGQGKKMMKKQAESEAVKIYCWKLNLS